METNTAKKIVFNSTLPTTQLSALCTLIKAADTPGTKAQASACISEQSNSRYTKPTAWVYDSFYDDCPVGLIFSPTTGLTFYLPIDENNKLSFENASYLEKSFSALTRRMRTGNCISSSEIGTSKPLPNASLAGWIERTLLRDAPLLQ